MKSTWIRVIISLLVGGALQETVRLSTGKEVGALFFVGAIVTYIIISAIVYYRNIWLLQRKADENLKQNDEVIDDFK